MLIRQNLISRLEVLILLLMIATPLAAQQTITVENSSQHPKVSTRLYTDVSTQSVYITMRDGVRLAVDIFRPILDDDVVSDPLPLIWTHNRYVRAQLMNNGRRIDTMSQPTMKELVLRGYIVASVDVRGGGASFGSFHGPFNPTETQDAREIIEWFASQDFCDGNIGMYGGSYLGGTQYMAAATLSPHLKAIIPSVAPADLYAFCYAGGIYRNDFLESWSNLTTMLDTQAPVAPVDEDTDRRLLTQAKQDHSSNRNTDEQFRAIPFRDSIDPKLGIAFNEVSSPVSFVKEISQSNVAIYHIAGWYDVFVRDSFVLYRNLDNPQRMAIGPWFHQQRHEYDNLGEHLRWFDRYLKGVDNGIDQEAPIQYYVMGAPEGQRWQSAWEWPLPEEQRIQYYLHARAVDRHDGLLSRKQPKPNPGRIEYTIDYSTTSGKSNRWRNAYGGPGAYSDMAPNDLKGLHFTTAPLSEDVEITGHPVAKLWVNSTTDDGDFIVYLEEVDAEGYSHYITEGSLRASHRSLSVPGYDYLGLPYHRSYAADVKPLTGEPTLLEIDLQPTSNIFDKGHRIRVTITCADRDNMETPIVDPIPIVTLDCNPERASSIVLPIIPHRE